MHAYLISRNDMPTSSLNSRTYSSTPLRVCCTMEQYTLATPGCKCTIFVRVWTVYLQYLFGCTFIYSLSRVSVKPHTCVRCQMSVFLTPISGGHLTHTTVRGDTCSGHKQQLF